MGGPTMGGWEALLRRLFHKNLSNKYLSIDPTVDVKSPFRPLNRFTYHWELFLT